MAVSANKLELLQIADAVAREKSIDRGIVIAAMEDAIAKAARARYGSETDVHAEIDAKKSDPAKSNKPKPKILNKPQKKPLPKNTKKHRLAAQGLPGGEFDPTEGD